MIGERGEYEKNLIKQCFKEKDTFLKCVEKIPNEQIFKDLMAKLFWQIFMMIYREGEAIHKSVVHDVLKATENDELIPLFDQYVTNQYNDEDQWEYHLTFLNEQYRKEIMLKLSDEIRTNIGNKSSEELLNDANSILVDLNSSEVVSKSFKESYLETVKQIRNIAQGSGISILKTGHQEIDDLISFGPKQIVFLAAQKKQGKSRFMVHLADRLVQFNKQDIKVQWYSLEMSNDEMIRLFMSKKMGLDDKQLQNINYQLTEEELTKLEGGYKYFEDYPIDFVDETLDIFKLCSKAERFADACNGKVPVIIIDNLGLITPHQKNEVQNDNDVSRMLKELRDKTGALIIVLHHISKESEGKFNITEQYAPKVAHIRGSSRLADFANKVLLLHRPEMYRDVVKHFEKENKGHLIHGRMELNCALNRNGGTGLIDFRHDIAHCNFFDW